MPEFDIKEQYLRFLRDDPDITMPVAAIEALVQLLSESSTSTSAELIQTLKEASATLKASVSNSMSLSAGCDLFMRFVLRNIREYNDWEACKGHLVKNGRLFAERSKAARATISQKGLPFVRDDDVILVHSFSRTVLALLEHAAKNLVRFRVFVTEAAPSGQGKKMARALRQRGIPVSLIVDNAVGSVIDQVSKVFCGAEGVAESGGVINQVGTYQTAVLAKNANKPFYIVTESHKFVRIFPLSQSDLPDTKKMFTFSVDEPEDDMDVCEGSSPESPVVDFTPHDYITALITDLGVLTPSGVSEELIKMWYE